MPRMRADEKLIVPGTSVDSNFISGNGAVGQQSNVALFIKSDKACTFKIQVSGTTLSAGRNADVSTNEWFDWHRAADADGVETITLTAGQAIAVDLSPFAPQYFRLVCTSMTGGPSTATEAFAVAV